MELTIQVKSLKLKPEFVALSPDGASILFSDGRHIAWSQLPQDFSTPILASCDLETRGRIGLASVHPTMLSALIKKDNTHVSIFEQTGVMSLGNNIYSVRLFYKVSATRSPPSRPGLLIT